MLCSWPPSVRRIASLNPTPPTQKKNLIKFMNHRVLKFHEPTAASSDMRVRLSHSKVGSLCLSTRLSLQGLPSFYLNCNLTTKKTPLLSVAVSAKHDDEYESQSINAPLEPQSWEGSFLAGLLKNQPHIFPIAAAEQLEELASQRDGAYARWEHSMGSEESCLHRRIAEMKEQDCHIAIEDIMYLLIVFKFSKIKVPLVPNLSRIIENGSLNIWPPRETDLESIHGEEVLELVHDHLSSVIRLVPKSDSKMNRLTLQISRLQFGRVYAASIMYGYFLKSVSTRHWLESIFARSTGLKPINQLMNVLRSSFWKGKQENSLALGGTPQTSSSSNPSSVVDTRTLWGYMMTFDPKTLQLCAKLRSREAGNLIERYSWALFGDSDKDSIDNKELVLVDDSSLKRLLLEAIAFGSFLWDVEDNVDEIYKLQDS